MTAPLARLRGIVKRFGDCVSVAGVDLDVVEGEVLAVVGENGAGKSTLLRVLAGMHAPTAGTVEVGGAPLPAAAGAAIAAGVGMVHQHFMLAADLTGLENLILGAEPVGAGGVLDLARARREAAALADRHGLAIDLDRRVEDMSVGERQRLEVLKVLHRGARILVLDEPTAVLTPDESRRLLALCRDLANRPGHAVVIVTHKLGEVVEVADRVVVLRRGAKVQEARRGELDEGALAEAMVGGRVELPSRDAAAAESADGDVVLALRDVVVPRAGSREPALSIASLEVRAGEIVGVAGVEGNGQAELVDVIAGLASPSRGAVRIAGVDVTRASVAARLAGGLAVVHADRHERGLVLPLPIADSFALGRTRELSRRGLLRRDLLDGLARTAIARFDVRGGSPATPAAALSGGNQQKIVIAREVGRTHRILVAAHPTRGVDVGAIRRIREALLEERAAGRGVLLVSTDLDELLALADRLVVLYRGRIVDEGRAGERTADDLGRHMAGTRRAQPEVAGG